MNRGFFIDTAAMQFEPSSQSPWKLMTAVPEIQEICSEEQISRPNWGKSDRVFSQFESLSSMASSPVLDNNVAVGKLTGKYSPAPVSVTAPPPYGTTNIPRIRNSMPVNPNLPLLTADPAFAERAAKFSCFGSRSFNGGSNQLGLISNSNTPEIRIGSDVISTGKLLRVSSSPALKDDRFPVAVGCAENRVSDEIDIKLSRLSGSAANSNEESSVSEQIPSGEFGFENRKEMNSRKRKGGSLKDGGSNTKKEEDVIDESKRSKKIEEESGGKMEENTEPPKDYIHVRARRGQATDSHSLAERVRREKISERMKLLQNLVPNCNKVTGKALMLDEIINYVQSLQRQVEFLSMKLATVNPGLDFDTNNLISQNVNQSKGNLCQQTPNFYQQNAQVIFDGSVPMTRPVHEFTEPFSHTEGFGQDDLQSIVRMGFGESLDLDASFFHYAADQPSDMKIEL